MKKLLSIAFLFISAFTYAGDTSLVKKSINGINQSLSEVRSAIDSTINIPDSASVTFSKVYTDVKTGIAALASSLKVGAEHVYEILVRQQLVKSITWLVEILVIILLFIFMAKPVWKWSTTNADESGGISYAPGVILYICLSVSLIVGLCHIENIITGFVNPEYGAIKDIISIVNPQPNK